MQATTQLGMVVVGGTSSGYYTDVTRDGLVWTQGTNFPLSSYGMSSVIYAGDMLVFGSYSSRNAYRLKTAECNGNINTEGCFMNWELIGSLLATRYYHRSVVKDNTVIHIGGTGSTQEYIEKWTFNTTDSSMVLSQKTSSYSIKFDAPEAYSVPRNYCFPNVEIKYNL